MSRTSVITDVTLIDGTGAEPDRATDVVVRDGVIVGRGPGIGSGVDGEIVVGTGKFLIPGLWDTETHLTRPVTGVLEDMALDGVDQVDAEAAEAQLGAYPRYGFTTVVDLGGPEEFLAGLRARQESGALAGPRLLMTGRQFTAIDGPPSDPDGRRWSTVTVDVDTVDSARTALDRMHGEFGIDAIKVNMPGPSPMHKDGPTISAEILEMLVHDGHRHDLPVHVHIDTVEAAVTALRAGVDNIEHFFEADPETVEADVERVTELCLQTGAYWPFTLVLWEGLSRLGDPALLADLQPERTVLPRVLDRFLRHPHSAWLLADDAMRAQYRAWFDTASRFLPIVHAAGVPSTIATDAGAPGDFHGPTAVREMVLSVQAGLSPMDVIGMATRDSARKLRRDRTLGTLEVGKIADMVLLAADPLADIGNLVSIDTVFQAGVATVRPAVPAPR